VTAKITDTILGPARGTEEEAWEFSETKRDRDYFREVFRLAPLVGIDPAIVVGQWHLETAGGNSPRWVNNGNPAGLGIESDDDADPAVFTGNEAAKVHLQALLVACDGPLHHLVALHSELPESADPFIERWVAKYRDPACPTVKTIDDLNIRYVDATGEPQATWAWDADYQDKLVARMTLVFANLPDQETTSTPPQGGPMYSTEIPGLPGGPLTTNHPIHIKLIPEWRTNNRPGYTALTPRRSVQHGNGNPRSSAAGEANYLYNGAEGRQASYHSATDDKETWIMVPASEVTWQAADGSGPGNMNGFSNEMVEDSTLWANPTRRDKVIANAAELMGGVAARLNIDKPEQHWTFNYESADRHDCPNKLRYVTINGRLAWDIYAEKWRAAKVAERQRMNGEQPTPTPPPKPPTTYADAITKWMGDDLKKASPSDHTYTTKVDGVSTKVKIWGAEREYEVLKSTPRYQGPDVKGKKVGGTLVVSRRRIRDGELGFARAVE
jgi:N-acetylmuramoyl-L-alanine amidase CwlA